MNIILLTISIILITTNSFGQLPNCVREKCDSILQIEVGKEIFSNCIEYIGYECTKKLDTITDKPCEAHSRHSYLVRYKFSFPNQDNASFRLGFSCTAYFGSVDVKSEYFLRTNQSDLPKDFREKGLKIVAYEKIVKKALKKDPLVGGNGVLALNQDRILWVFSTRRPYKNPDGIGDESSVSHTVWVDPYTGKLIANQIRSE